MKIRLQFERWLRLFSGSGEADEGDRFGGGRRHLPQRRRRRRRGQPHVHGLLYHNLISNNNYLLTQFIMY